MKDLIVQLRKQTGAGVGDVVKALKEANNDMDKAAEILRKSGAAKAAKRAGRETGEGYIGMYLHANGKVAAMVELQCETDFVAKNEEFQKLAKDIAMQIAAMNPLYVKAEDVPADVVEKEKEIYREEMKDEVKPEDVIEKIVEGKLNKYYEDACLLNQKFFKDDSMTIEQLITQKIAIVGENIEVGNMKRFAI